MDTARRPGGLDAAASAHVTADLAIVLALAAFYVVTAPANHSLAIDPYFYAGLITEGAVGVVPHPREMLWILGMQGIHHAVAAILRDPDPFLIARVVNSVVTAVAVLVFARVLERDLGQPRPAAWLSAGLFGATYAIWRYATEIEVYAPAVLLSLLILRAAFAFDRPATGRLAGRTARLAALGAVATLAYQPIGFLPAVAVPAYLAARGHLRQLPLYFGVSGALVLAGFATAVALGPQEQATGAVGHVFHASELAPGLPTLGGLAAMAFAIGSDLLSTHWIFAHDGLRAVAEAASANGVEEEAYAAARAGWLAWVPAITLPAALALTAAMVPAALRHRPDPALRPRTGIIALWLLLHAGLMIALAPGGFEGWILGLVPLSLLAAVRLVGPTMAAGRRGTVAALLVVVLVHNGLAGIGIVRSERGDYLRPRGEAVLARTGPGDLILVPDKWGLAHYLDLMGEATVLRVDAPGREAARRAVADTLARGGRVVMLDDVRGVMDDAALAGAERFDTGDVGTAYGLGPEGGGS